jgi:hypothetical protein
MPCWLLPALVVSVLVLLAAAAKPILLPAGNPRLAKENFDRINTSGCTAAGSTNRSRRKRTNRRREGTGGRTRKTRAPGPRRLWVRLPLHFAAWAVPVPAADRAVFSGWPTGAGSVCIRPRAAQPVP